MAGESQEELAAAAQANASEAYHAGHNAITSGAPVPEHVVENASHDVRVSDALGAGASDATDANKP